MLFEMPDEDVSDREEDRQSDHAKRQAGIVRNQSQDGMFHDVMDHVCCKSVGPESSEKAELQPPDVASHYE